ncbi:hypothetical protein GQX73_g8327 [Xylaria multiplex]|uniref:Uncharacterized protein n=1 Tax=Xylaria multiplex TaxID=323545 RepID=A0A7C8IMI1_9PEZI|nr:hypothetical protein GQX73_g8327 [Xylaria multiplex]
MDEDEDGDVDPQPDQYARDNHLSINSRIHPISLASIVNHSLPQLTPDARADGLTSDSCLSQLHLPTINFEEQLDVPEESSVIITRAIQYDILKLNGQYDTPLAQYEARKRLYRLKLEPPVLCDDPDYDSRELAASIRKQRQPFLSAEMFPFERLNIDNDEGLGFSTSARQFGQQLDYIICQEKFDVPKEVMYQMACALRGDWCGDEISRTIKGEIPCRTFTRNLVVTPPLSPFMEHEEYFIPDVEACEVPIASDFSSMLGDDAKAAESAILQNEFEKDFSPVLDIDTIVLSPLPKSLGLGGGFQKSSSVRMESPLSPITSPPQSTSEEPNIPVLLRSMDVDHILSHPQSAGMGVLRAEGTNCTFDRGIETVMNENAATVLQSIGQDHISITGAIARVEVPVTDFSIPEPEWQSLSIDARAHLKWLYKTYNIAIPSLPRYPRADDSKLRWAPFLRKIDLKTLTREYLNCEDSPYQLLNPLDAVGVPTSANYVWKRPGLAILRELENEEDPENMESPTNTIPDSTTIPDLTRLARKRRFEKSSIGMGMSLSPSSNSSVGLIVPSQHKGSLRQTLTENVISQTNFLPSVESNPAVSTLLSSYIDVRTAKRHKQDKSLFFLPVSKARAELPFKSICEKSQPEEEKFSLHNLGGPMQEEVRLLPPYPRMNIPNTPAKLIKGLTLSRGLFSTLEQLYPTVEIIERDFGRWNTAAWSYYSIMRSTVMSPLAAEADVIVSPATGIIVTTLLKVIQKPLPYRGRLSLICERIASVALRYERLIVLVSEGNVVDETVRDLTPSESTAYAEFVIFVASLNSNIEVFYVGGGEVTLARWLVYCTVRYAPEAAEIQEHLIQDETMWEVFLRRVGFNAYAAQAILACLQVKNDNSRDDSECTKYGLAALVVMTDAERVQNFRDLMCVFLSLSTV